MCYLFLEVALLSLSPAGQQFRECFIFSPLAIRIWKDHFCNLSGLLIQGIRNPKIKYFHLTFLSWQTFSVIKKWVVFRSLLCNSCINWTEYVPWSNTVKNKQNKTKFHFKSHHINDLLCCILWRHIARTLPRKNIDPNQIKIFSYGVVAVLICTGWKSCTLV